MTCPESAIGTATGVGGELPSLRFHEKQSPRDGDTRILNDHQVKSDVNSLCDDLFEHLSVVGTLL